MRLRWLSLAVVHTRKSKLELETQLPDELGLPLAHQGDLGRERERRAVRMWMRFQTAESRWVTQKVAVHWALPSPTREALAD